MTSRRRRGLVGLVASAALVAALAWSPWDGSSGRDASTRSGPTSRSTGDGSGDPSRGPTTTGPIVDGGTVRLGLAGPVLADPAYASSASPSDLMVLDLLYDGLTRMPRSGDDPGAQGGEAVPALAASWTPSADLRTWRFALRPDARFSTGRAITSADVVASLTHVIAGGDASPSALRLEPVQGFRAYLEGSAPGVSGLRAVDAQTVEVALDGPMAQLPVLLAAPSYGITDVPALTPLAGAADLPEVAKLGFTGGWQADGADPAHLRLLRSVGTAGHLEAVELHPFADGLEAYAAFEDGLVDWAPVPGERYGAAVDAFGEEAFSPFQAELALGLRVDDPVLASLPLRRAIAAALDRDAIVQAVYPDGADALATIVPSGVPGRAVGAAPPHSAATARRVLREAFPNGVVPTVSLDHDASAAPTALMRLVAESLDDVGIPTRDRSLALDAYQRLLVSGDQQVFVLSWLGGAVSPGAYLDPLLRSTSPDNLLGVRDPALDGQLDTARSAVDPAAAAAAWDAVERSALGDVLIIPLAQLRTQVVVGAAVAGLHHAVDGTVDWTAVHRTDA